MSSTLAHQQAVVRKTNLCWCLNEKISGENFNERGEGGGIGSIGHTTGKKNEDKCVHVCTPFFVKKEQSGLLLPSLFLVYYLSHNSPLLANKNRKVKCYQTKQKKTKHQLLLLLALSKALLGLINTFRPLTSLLKEPYPLPLPVSKPSLQIIHLALFLSFFDNLE